MKAAVRGVRHCTLRTRLLDVAAIVALGCARYVNPRSDQLILKRLPLSNAADWECGDSGHRDRTKAQCALPVHKASCSRTYRETHISKQGSRNSKPWQQAAAPRELR